MYCSHAKRRYISAHVSSTRRTSNRLISRVQNDSLSINYGRTELDTHADTIVLGSNCVVLNYTGRVCDVSPYTDTYKSITDVPIVTGATAWTCRHTGETFILVFHESLWMGDVMDHTLLNPNQLRHYGVTVQDNPHDGVQQMHISPDSHEYDLYLPLESEGTTIFLTSRTPTDQELHECTHVPLTSRSFWDPHAVQFPQITRHMEEGAMNRANAISRWNKPGYTSHGECCIDADLWLCPRQFTDRLIAEVRVPEVLSDVPERQTFISSERHSMMVTPEEISERWAIGLAQARSTLKVTTQNAVRSAAMPRLSRRYDIPLLA